MYHYVYKISFVSGDYYIGKHSTEDLCDDYKGSGVELKERYENNLPYEFTILKHFNSSAAAYDYEYELIGELWKTDDSCLNRCPGGLRGFVDITGLPKTTEHKRKIAAANSKKKEGKALEASLNNLKKAVEYNTGRKHSQETIDKRRYSLKKHWDNKEDKSRPHLNKPVLCEGVFYESVQSVMEEFGISRPTVINRIKSSKWDWKYARA